MHNSLKYFRESKFVWIPILLLILLLNVFYVYSQSGINVYYGNGRDQSSWIVEHYDHGFLFLGNEETASGFKGILIKTDVNGKILWKKKIGDNNKSTIPIYLSVNNNGLITITGATNKLDQDFDPFILILNTCGEIEHIFIISTKDYNYSTYAELLDNEYLISASYRILNNDDQSTTFLKTSLNGEIIWQNTNYGVLSEGGVIHLNNSYLATGYTYKPSITDTTINELKPCIFRIDEKGRTKYYNVFGEGTDKLGSGISSISSNEESVITLVSDRSYRKDRFPVARFYFTNQFGQTDSSLTVNASQNDFIEPSQFIALNQDDIILTSLISKERNSYDFDLKVSKVRKDGTGIDSTIIDTAKSLWTYSIAKTHDNKILIGGTIEDGISSMVLIKLNSNLEYDSFDHSSYTYDSLCINQISSSNIYFSDPIVIPLELDSLLSNNDNDQLSLNFTFNNPVKDDLVIYANNNILNQEYNLRILNLEGKELKSVNFNSSLKVKMSEFSKGVYLLLIEDQNNLQCSRFKIIKL